MRNDDFFTLLPRLHLFELVTLLHQRGLTPEQKGAAERAILLLIPETPLGNKITLARRGTPRILEALFREKDPRLFEAILANPALDAAQILTFLRGPAAGAEAISAIARHPRFGQLPAVRHALLRNGKTPAIWYTLFLPRLNRSELERLSLLPVLGERQRKEVEAELAKRTGQAT